MGYKVVITGSSGMIGRATLLECLDDPQIEEILLLNRNPLNLSHPKVKEVLCPDFMDIENLRTHIKGYDACFHCMGVSVMGLKEEQYHKLTFDITKNLADIVFDEAPNAVFNYVSGTGTDSTEKGGVMWARVKGKTENYILNKGFKDAYAFRPGAIVPERGVKSRTGWYNFFYVISRPFFPLMKRSSKVVGSADLGKAMINTLMHPSTSKHLEAKQINDLAAVSEQ